MELTKQKFFEKIQETYDDLKSKLEEAGHRVVPTALQKSFDFESEKTKYEL